MSRRGGWRNRAGGLDTLVEISDHSLSEQEANAGLEQRRGELCLRSEQDGCGYVWSTDRRRAGTRETRSATLVVPEGGLVMAR